MKKFKKDIVCLYFFAYWDDCETPSGVAESIRRGVKLCHTVIV